MSPGRALVAMAVLVVACGGGEPQPETMGPGPGGTEGGPHPMAGPFTPPEGQALLIVGQDLGAVAGYVGSVHPAPGGVTTYTSLWSLGGLEESANWGSGDVDGRALSRAYPESALVIGLQMVETAGDEMERLVEGEYDEQVDRLGGFIRRAERPVFLRIGYEFDGPWNHYAPVEYIAAWRYLVDRLRASGVANLATVWQSAANVTLGNRPFSAWWPGNDYVDWVGTSLFFLDESLGRHRALIDWATTRGKPLMVCELSPRGYSLDESPDGPAPFAYPDRGLTFSRTGSFSVPEPRRRSGTSGTSRYSTS